MGFLGVRFEVFGGGANCPLSKACQNYARNFKILHVCTHADVVLGNIPFSA